MPIKYDFTVKQLSQDEFHAVDRVVMRQAFDIQNELGRFYNENVYQNELLFRLRAQGLPVISEGLINVQYQDFVKHYYIDMVVQGGALYELKAVEALNEVHEMQLIHYLLLLGLHHGKLINFYPASVEHRFVSTNLTAAICRNIHFDDHLWKISFPEDQLIPDIIHSLLSDWGACLDVALYEDAILHFLGNSEDRVSSVDVCIDGRVVGAQKLFLLQEDTSLHISALTKNKSSYRKHITRLFDHTCLTRIQWVNFNRNRVELITLKK